MLRFVWNEPTADFQMPLGSLSRLLKRPAINDFLYV